MSARLNLNEIAYFPWKGKTFNQITSIIKQNSIPSYNTTKNYYHAQPLKIYRREVITRTSTPYPCNPRVSSSIDVIDMPGGSIVNPISNINGIINTLDINLTNDTSQLPGVCQTNISNCFSQTTNARRRVRSSGIIKRQFNIAKNNDTY